MMKVAQEKIRRRSAWPDEALQGGFIAVPFKLIDQMVKWNISSPELTLILCLLRYKRGEEHPYPSYETLGKLMGLHSRRVRQIAKDLQDKGFLVRLERRGEGHRSQTNEFDLELLMSRVVRLVARDKAAKEAAAKDEPDVGF